MSPSSLYSQQVLCSSIPLSKNVHSVFSAFCTEENIEQSISYLDQVLCFCKKQEHVIYPKISKLQEVFVKPECHYTVTCRDCGDLSPRLTQVSCCACSSQAPSVPGSCTQESNPHFIDEKLG